MKNIQILYFKSDVVILGNIFENFCDKTQTTYGLDSSCYFTRPGYTWSYMLKYAKCKLDTIQDVDILLCIKRGIRGEISHRCKIYAETKIHILTIVLEIRHPISFILISIIYMGTPCISHYRMGTSGEMRILKNCE